MAASKAKSAHRAVISLAAIPAAIAKLERRLSEVSKTPPLASDTDTYGYADRVAARVNATIDDVFEKDTADATDFYISAGWFTWMGDSWEYTQKYWAQGHERTRASLTAAIERLKEKQIDADHDAEGRTLRAYDGLDLHPEISRAATDLYRDGHYSNAIEDAVKALNGLVRLRSGEEGDGMPLMQTVFSPKNPVLRFNDMRDQSDINEQTGFMMMFSGAVAGLRNPRAHSLIKDDAERALEFIAFVSLLAKLLDEALKGPPSAK